MTVDIGLAIMNLMKIDETCFDPVTCSRWPFLAVRVRTVREESLQELVAAGADEIQEILEKKVLVLVGHTRDVVHHVSGIVLNKELRSASLEVGIRRKRGRTLDETVVSSGRVGMRGGTGVV